MGADDELEDWDDGIQLIKAAPRQTTNVWGNSEKEKKQKKHDSHNDDPLSFLKKAEEEKKALQ